MTQEKRNGKGDKPRPKTITQAEYGKRYEAIFKKPSTKKHNAKMAK